MPLREKENLEEHVTRTRRKSTPISIQRTFSLKMAAVITADRHPKVISVLNRAILSLTRVPVIPTKLAHISMTIETGREETHQEERDRSAVAEGTHLEEDILTEILTMEGEDHLAEDRPGEDRREADHPDGDPVEYLTPIQTTITLLDGAGAEPRHHPHLVGYSDHTPSARKKKWTNVREEDGTLSS